MIPCRFFSRGLCRNGDGCAFLHERSAGGPLRPNAPTFPAIGTLNINTRALSTSLNSSQSGHQQEAQVSSDSRGKIPCRFVSRPGGCRNTACPYSHGAEGPQLNGTQSLEGDVNEDKDEDAFEDFSRNLAGAVVCFNLVGDVDKVSLPTDFSTARITGLPPQTTQETAANILRELHFEVTPDCVRIPRQDSTLETMAIVKVEDPLFARALCDKVRQRKSNLQAMSLPIGSKRTNARKVHLSWHKSTRTVRLNFTCAKDAHKVISQFKKGEYKILSQTVNASAERTTDSHYSYNPVAWTVTLTDVPGAANSRDVEAAIHRPGDRPKHIEMGKASYASSDAEVSVDIRSRLEEHGPLDNFHMSPTHSGKRVKATAWFREEADARSACSLNNSQLHILGKGKLTVTLIHVVKNKVSTAIYNVSKTKLDQESQKWKEQHLTLHTYHDPQKHFTTIKVEGENAKDLAIVRKSLDETFCGDLLVDENTILWGPSFNSNGFAYRKLKAIEKEVGIIFTRDKRRRRLYYHGPPEKLRQTILRVKDLLRGEPATVHYINLDPAQRSWAIRGGFRNIQRILGDDAAVFDIVSKKIAIHGTEQQHEVALDIMAGKRTALVLPRSDSAATTGEHCPICFCEAENPIKTSCQHTYCLECFEECCKATTSSSNVSFQVKCLGDEGKCGHTFTLQELRDSVSSSIFETVLQSSFEDHIKRHPNLFHYCPTPDCDYIYRCAITHGANRPTYTCSNCLEIVCTSCHALHGRYTCAEYKDIQSGGYEALAKLKKELNIKDCPRCTTPMEKTEGCNHMTCSGCKAHICWVCMAVFSTSKPCYDHMMDKHGSIGLGLEHFM